MSELLPVAAPSRELVAAALGPKKPRGIKTPLDLLARVEEESPEAARALQREVAAFPLRFVVNEVRNLGDVAIAHKLVAAGAGHLGLRASYAGYIHHDDAVWQAVRRCLFMSGTPTSRASQEVRQLTPALVKGEGLVPGY